MHEERVSVAERELRLTSEPLRLESGPQLLIDDHLVDDIWMIRRSPEMPLKSMDNPVMRDDPYFEGGRSVGTILYDDEEGLFKMWYGVGSNANTARGRPEFHTTAYATSRDGLEWESPNLSLVELNGSADNNICLGLDQGTGFVLFDPDDPDPSRRYKMTHKRLMKPGLEGRATASFSPDGIHWTPAFDDERRSVRPRSGDGSNVTLYDPNLGKYVLFCRATVLAAPKSLDPRSIGFPTGWVRQDDFTRPSSGVGEGEQEEDAWDGTEILKEKLGFPREEDIVWNREAEDYIHRFLKVDRYVNTQGMPLFTRTGVGCNRRIARAESDDYLHWTVPEVVIAPDELDPPKFYNIKACRYAGMYFGTLQLFHAWGYRRQPGSPQESETVDVQLTFSRDGKHWDRLANRPVFIERGLIGSFDAGGIASAVPPILSRGDELWMYYNGASHAHCVPGGRKGVGVAKLPKDRLVARTAGDELGVLITKPFIWRGKTLQVNADARRGLMKVEVADLMGDEIDGYTVHDSPEIREDGLRIDIGWKGDRSLGALEGRPVRLRFYLYRARLYAFEAI